jgi:hypothetical protein
LLLVAAAERRGEGKETSGEERRRGKLLVTREFSLSTRTFLQKCFDG